MCLFLHKLCSFFAGFSSLASASAAATTTSGSNASSQSQTSSTLVVASSSRYVYDPAVFQVFLLYKKKREEGHAFELLAIMFTVFKVL